MGMSKLIDRIKYRAIKKYTFDQMVTFVTTLYTEGYKAATIDMNKAVFVLDEKKLEGEIKELFRKEFGIGDQRYYRANMRIKILEAINSCTTESKVTEVDVKLKDNTGEDVTQ